MTRNSRMIRNVSFAALTAVVLVASTARLQADPECDSFNEMCSYCDDSGPWGGLRYLDFSGCPTVEGEDCGDAIG